MLDQLGQLSPRTGLPEYRCLSDKFGEGDALGCTYAISANSLQLSLHQSHLSYACLSCLTGRGRAPPPNHPTNERRTIQSYAFTAGTGAAVRIDTTVFQVQPDENGSNEKQTSSEFIIQSASQHIPTFARAKQAAAAAFLAYVCIVILLILSARAQTFLIYLHWINPPTRIFPLTDLKPYRLSNVGRNIHVQNLRGWHVLPPGAPFAPANADAGYYDARLAEPYQRTILFFHGNAGTRAFPSKRVNLLKLLNAQFNAHVITFDYSGFGDSRGKPSEETFYADARLMLDWLCKHVHNTSSIFLYGQSLGSFAATRAALFASTPHMEPPVDAHGHEVDDETPKDARLAETDTLSRSLTGMILDAPPASLQSAARTHPMVKLFRIAGLSHMFGRIIHESHDSTSVIASVRIPILILHGRLDGMIPSWQGRLLADCARKDGNSQVRFVEFDNVGHVDVAGAEGFLSTVHEFLMKSENDLLIGPLRGHV